MSAELLSIRNLSVEVPAPGGGWRPVLRSLSLDVGRGEHVALIGESGSGKSVAALACLGLVAPSCRITGGSVVVGGVDTAAADSEQLRQIRGRDIGLVFQEPAAAFNPVLTIGRQIAETVRAHHAIGSKEAKAAASQLLARTALDGADVLLRAYPHQLSGGQLQRAMIALALAGDPALLIADEPTTALDLRTQARILDLLRGLAREGRALLLIGHDLSIVRGLVDRVVVLFAGEVVEAAPTEALFDRPLHPYSRELLAAAAAAGQGGVVPAARLPTLPRGCGYAARCSLAEDRCRRDHPALEAVAADRMLRCPVVRRGETAASEVRGA